MCEFLGGQIIIERSWKAQTYLSSSEPAPSLTGAQHRAGDLRHTRRSYVPAGTATAGSAGLEASGCSAIPPWRETAEATAGCSGAGARTSEAGDGAGRRRPTCRRHTLNVGRLWLYGSPKARAQINCGSSRAVGQVSFR
jgi:hypothetical protein